jgi:hypothetical protein
MKQILFILLFSIVPLSWAEEITLKCDYYVHSGNEPALKDYSNEPSLIASRCDEIKFNKRVQAMRRGVPDAEVWSDNFLPKNLCKTEKSKYISFDESKNIIKVLEGSSWKSYANTEPERRCLDEVLCRVKTQDILINEDKVVLNIRDRFQSKLCPFPLPELEVFLGAEYDKYMELLGSEAYNAYLEGCYAFDLSGTFQTDQDSFTIDRKTGKYSEVTTRGKTTHNGTGKSIKGITLRGALTKETLWAQYIDEEATCSLVSKGKKF